MSLERVLKTLEGLGLSKTDAKVYIYLAKKGPTDGRQLVIDLQVKKQQLYPILGNLKNKGLVSSTGRKPALFSAIAFEEVIELLIKIKDEQVKVIKQTKRELLENWRSISLQEKT